MGDEGTSGEVGCRITGMELMGHAADRGGGERRVHGVAWSGLSDVESEDETTLLDEKCP
jgi:hypothetical protein